MVPPMYVCICRAVTDKQLDSAVAKGASSLDELMTATGACTGCGCCKNAVQAHLSRRAQESRSVPGAGLSDLAASAT